MPSHKIDKTLFFGVNKQIFEHSVFAGIITEKPFPNSLFVYLLNTHLGIQLRLFDAKRVVVPHTRKHTPLVSSQSENLVLFGRDEQQNHEKLYPIYYYYHAFYQTHYYLLANHYRLLSKINDLRQYPFLWFIKNKKEEAKVQSLLTLAEIGSMEGVRHLEFIDLGTFKHKQYLYL